MAQHHIAGEFHVPVVLRQFFVTLEHKASLRPGALGLAHEFREGTGLITADTFEVVWKLLLEFTYGLPDLRHGPLSTKFCIAVTVHLTPSQGGAYKVARQSDTVGQNDEGCTRIGHIVRALVHPLVT
jgi:hypothetical protein